MAREKKATDPSAPKKTTSRKKAAATTPAAAPEVAPAPVVAANPDVTAEVPTPKATAPKAAAAAHSDNSKAVLPADIEEQIRRRAYEIFEKRGGQHGLHVEDWQRAEAEILSKYKAKA